MKKNKESQVNQIKKRDEQIYKIPQNIEIAQPHIIVNNSSKIIIFFSSKIIKGMWYYTKLAT